MTKVGIANEKGREKKTKYKIMEDAKGSGSTEREMGMESW